MFGKCFIYKGKIPTFQNYSIILNPAHTSKGTYKIKRYPCVREVLQIRRMLKTRAVSRENKETRIKEYSSGLQPVEKEPVPEICTFNFIQNV